jgi:prevent-host-death family protein
MTIGKVTVAEARSNFSDLLAQVELLGRRYVIARRGRPKAALVSIEDLARLEAMEGAGSAPRRGEREQALFALEQAGMLRPVSPELLATYRRLEEVEREVVRLKLAERRYEPPLSRQIIRDRGEADAS